MNDLTAFPETRIESPSRTIPFPCLLLSKDPIGACLFFPRARAKGSCCVRLPLGPSCRSRGGAGALRACCRRAAGALRWRCRRIENLEKQLVFQHFQAGGLREKSKTFANGTFNYPKKVIFAPSCTEFRCGAAGSSEISQITAKMQVSQKSLNSARPPARRPSARPPSARPPPVRPPPVRPPARPPARPSAHAIEPPIPKQCRNS